jgi:hypothetical protein
VLTLPFGGAEAAGGYLTNDDMMSYPDIQQIVDYKMKEQI